MKTFEELQELVRVSTTRGGSPFYRNLYGVAADQQSLIISSHEEWRMLPVFTKKELTMVPIESRIFTKWDRVDSIETTSGTSGKPPVFLPWTLSNGYQYRSRYHTFSRATLSSSAAIQQQEWILNSAPQRSRIVALDPKAPALSVRLAKASRVDSIFAFLYHILAISAEATRQGLANDIRFIEFYGEPCTKTTYDFLKKTFPNAVITSEYASKEVEYNPIGVLCRPITGREPLEVYHVSERAHIEIMDVNTGDLKDPADGVEGEIILTSGDSVSAFPLIRYRIGDIIRVVESACKDHRDWTFVVLGRNEIDFVKIPGGILRVDEVERTLREVSYPFPDEFEVHIQEGVSGDGPTFAFVLYLREPVSEATLRIVENLMRLGPSFTYAAGVDRGLYTPLQIRMLERIKGKAKRKRILKVPFI